MTDRFLVVLAFILTTACAAGAQPVSQHPASLERDLAVMRAELGTRR